jgi:single-stranded-DNA-specific exonuclease
VDAEVRLIDLDDKLARILHHMAPFGPGNMKPMFLSRGVIDTGQMRIVGEDHLKLCLRHANSDGPRFDAIAFRMAQHYEMVKSGEPFSILYTLEENEWNGRVTMQLNIKDIKAGVHGLLVGELNDTQVERIGT